MSIHDISMEPLISFGCFLEIVGFFSVTSSDLASTCGQSQHKNPISKYPLCLPWDKHRRYAAYPSIAHIPVFEWLLMRVGLCLFA